MAILAQNSPKTQNLIKTHIHNVFFKSILAKEIDYLFFDVPF